MKKRLIFFLIMGLFTFQSSFSQSNYGNCRSLFDGNTDYCENSYNFYTGYSFTSGTFGIENSDNWGSGRIGFVMYSIPVASTESLTVDQFSVVGLSIGGDFYYRRDRRNNPYTGVTLVVCDASYFAFNFGYRFVSKNSLFQLKLGGSVMIINWLLVPAADLTIGIRLR